MLFAFLAAMSSPDFTKFHKAVLKKALDNVGITATGSKDVLVDRCLKQPLEYRVGSVFLSTRFDFQLSRSHSFKFVSAWGALWPETKWTSTKLFNLCESGALSGTRLISNLGIAWTANAWTAMPGHHSNMSVAELKRYLHDHGVVASGQRLHLVYRAQRLTSEVYSELNRMTLGGEAPAPGRPVHLRRLRTSEEFESAVAEAKAKADAQSNGSSADTDGALGPAAKRLREHSPQ